MVKPNTSKNVLKNPEGLLKIGISYLESLPYEILLITAQYLDDTQLAYFCQVSKKISDICNDEDFWYQRFINKTGYDKPELTEKTWKDQYRNLKTGVRVQFIFARNSYEIVDFEGELADSLNRVLKTEEKLQIAMSRYDRENIERNLPKGLKVGDNDVYGASQNDFYTFEGRPDLKKLWEVISSITGSKDRWIDVPGLQNILRHHLADTGAILGLQDTLPLYISSSGNNRYIFYPRARNTFLIKISSS